MWEPKLKRAAFWHRCDECGERIEAGWPYIAINSKAQDPLAERKKGAIVVFRYHQGCHYNRLDRLNPQQTKPKEEWDFL